MTTDERIREAGFRIVSRPERGPATWQRGGKVATQIQALKSAMYEYRLKQVQPKVG